MSVGPGRDLLRRSAASVVVALLAAAPLLVACGGTSDSATEAAEPTADLLPPAEFAAYMAANPDVPVVNVHVPYEGHIAGTDAFVPFDQITAWDDLPEDTSAPIVLYCRSGNMSAQASADLAALGYDHLVDLDGGMKAWTAAGYELLDDPPPGVG